MRFQSDVAHINSRITETVSGDTVKPTRQRVSSPVTEKEQSVLFKELRTNISVNFCKCKFMF